MILFIDHKWHFIINCNNDISCRTWHTFLSYIKHMRTIITRTGIQSRSICWHVQVVKHLGWELWLINYLRLRTLTKTLLIIRSLSSTGYLRLVFLELQYVCIKIKRNDYRLLIELCYYCTGLIRMHQLLGIMDYCIDR
jgi:hypothetical protein